MRNALRLAIGGVILFALSACSASPAAPAEVTLTQQPSQSPTSSVPSANAQGTATARALTPTQQPAQSATPSVPAASVQGTSSPSPGSSPSVSTSTATPSGGTTGPTTSATSTAKGPGLGDTPWPIGYGGATRSFASKFAGPTSGKLLWVREIADPPSSLWSDLVLAGDGTIYALGEQSVYAISPSGDIVWRFDAAPYLGGRAGLGSPIVLNDGSLFTLGTDGTVIKINPDGTYRSSFKTDVVGSFGAAIDPNGVAYFGGSLTEPNPFIAVAPDGTELWRLPIRRCDLEKDEEASAACITFTSDFEGGYWMPPIVGPDRTIYALMSSFGSGSSRLYAFSPTGEVRWYIEQDDELLGPSYFGSFFLTPKGQLALNGIGILDSGDGSVIQRLPPGPEIIAQGSDGGFIGEDDGFFGVIDQEGNPLWGFAANDSHHTAWFITDSNGTLFTIAYDSRDRNVVAVSGHDGSTLWQVELPAEFDGERAAGAGIGSNGQLYIATRGGRVVAISD